MRDETGTFGPTTGSDPGSSIDARYGAPPESDRKPKQLIAGSAPDELRFTFFDQLEIGRYYEGRQLQPGQLLVNDPTVSSRHCVITQAIDGRCFVRDLSRNGTRVDGRRLVPNQEVEIRVGQTLSVSRNSAFQLAGEEPAEHAEVTSEPPATVLTQVLTTVTILVGDIRDYTVLVREAASSELQQSVSRVFQRLEREVVRLGGTVKEYQGDAIFAFWEEAPDNQHALRACQAALALDELARRIATDRSVWDVGDSPLQMDWALTTGSVLIDTYGGASPSGLSMIGEPVVLAFRLEKFANDQTGSMLACPVTRAAAQSHFEFADLGKMQAKGFEEADHVFALLGPAGPATTP